MSRPLVAGLVVGLWLFCGSLPAWSAGKGKAAAPFDVAAERIGALRLGLPADAAKALVPCPPEAGKEIYEGATGEYVQDVKMPACGLKFKMGGPRKGAAKKIASITASAPSELATVRGIRIGSTEAEVLAAYGAYRDKEGATKPGKVFVAGSIFDGLIFEFKNGRVTQIFLGAAAE
ncbi:MAG: hypothetical protein AB9872_07060 [Solidesulfovibrio sp.]